MKKLALISTYCNTWDKLNALYNTLIKLKELNIDSLVYSPLPLPSEITNISNFVFITKENPIIHWPERGMVHWKDIENHRTTLILSDYGWASVYQYKKLMELGSNFDYDYYFPLIYDLNLDTEVIKILNTPHKKMFFPSSKSKSSKVGGIFMSLSKENLNKLFPLINKQHYLEVCKGSIAEKYIEFLCDSVNGEVNPHITTDIMDEHGNISFNILSLTYPFKLAINQNPLRFLFYDLPKENLKITISIDDLYYDFDINSKNNFINFDKINTYQNIVLYYNQKPIDLTSYFTSKELIRLLETS